MGGAEVFCVRLQPRGEMDIANDAWQAVLLATMPLLLIPLEAALEGVTAILRHLGQ